MSDSLTDSQEPSSGSAQTQGLRNLPVAIHAQYVRDLSVENPNAPETLRPGQGQPETSVEINVDARKIEDSGEPDLYEVSLMLGARAQTGEQKTLFLIELSYAALVSLRDVPADMRHPLLLIEIPRMLFPFARQIITDMTAHSGYPPLLLQPVDFRAIYMQRFGQRDPETTDPETQAA